jgi:hypothetical protein
MGSLPFPNAEINVPTQDWAFWMSDDNAGKAANNMIKGYFANMRKILSNIADKVTKYVEKYDVGDIAQPI